MRFADYGKRVVFAAFDGGEITSDAGVLLLREQARRIHLFERMAGCFTDHRDRERRTHALPALLAQRVCGMALGYEDIIDHDTLRFDPALKLLASPRTGDPGTPAPLAGKSTLNRLEQSWETGNRRYHQMVPNLKILSNLFVTLFLDAHQTPPARITLDIDATDVETHGVYEEGLEGRLADLHDRVHSGAYRATPSRRVNIPKPDGGTRPLGVAAIEDKIVQKAVAEIILTPIYEAEFLGFSYGFRPGRGAHNALDALAVGILRRKINWVVDCDIRKFFDSVSRDWLVRFLEHRIGDKRVIRLIIKWLNAGVMEDGEWRDDLRGTPQGSVISPILANVYLHYVLDLWFQKKWRSHGVSGDTIIVRYADDFVVGFQHKRDAERFLDAVKERFGGFDLELHPDKTRLIEFGRYAMRDRRKRGQGRPETFDFLGLTHYCTETRRGNFMLGRKPVAKRMRRTLKRIKEALRRRRHDSVEGSAGVWLRIARVSMRATRAPANCRNNSAFWLLASHRSLTP